MKRLLSLVLVLALVLGVLASCDLPFDLPFFNNGVEESDIQGVVKELDDMYKAGNGTSIQNGYELIAQYKLGGTMFTITWTSDNEDIKIELVDGLYVVTLPKNTSGQSEYNLIATITSEGGQTATVKYNRVLAQSFGMITEPVVGTAYKLAFLHGNEKAVVYFDGNNYNNYAWYFSYTTDVLAAVDVYLETVEGVEGGYRLYFNKDGVKTYIVAFPRDGDTTKGTLKFDTTCPTEYFTYDTEHNTFIYTSVTGQQFYFGSSGTYKSISCSAISYLNSATSYPVHLYGVGGIEETLPEQQLPTIPDNYTSEDVVEALYKLEPGQTIEDTYVITGVVTSIKETFDPSYNNVSVNIVVGNLTDKPVLLYRITGTGADTLKVGDTVTVRAGLTNYNGTYETTSGGIIENIGPGVGGGDNGDNGDNGDSGDTNTAIVLNLTGNANLVSGSGEQNVFAQNGITFTNDKASSSSALTVQTSYAQRAYAGSTVKIEYPGMTKIVITFDDYTTSDGKTYMSGFDGMTVAGATLTRDNDVLTIVFDAATDVFQSGTLASQVRIEKIEVYAGEVENGGNQGGNEGGNEGGNTGTTPTVDATLNLTGNSNLVSGSADQIVFAANGITYTNDKASSTSDLVVQASYAQRAYKGSTVKIEYPGMTMIVITFDDYEYNGTTYMSGFDGMSVAGATFSRDGKVLTIVFDEAVDVFQSTAMTSQVRIAKIDVYTDEIEGGNGGNGGDNGDNGDNGNSGTTTPTYTAPEEDTAYLLSMELPSGAVYFSGSMSGNYLATTTNQAAGVKIFFEAVDGGYYIYFMNNGVKTYITAAAYLKDNGYAGCHFSLSTETPELVWTYNTQYGIIEIYDEISGKSDTFFAGTYGSYSTISLSGAYYKDQIASGTQYPARLILVEAA